MTKLDTTHPLLRMQSIRRVRDNRSSLGPYRSAEPSADGHASALPGHANQRTHALLQILSKRYRGRMPARSSHQAPVAGAPIETHAYRVDKEMCEGGRA